MMIELQTPVIRLAAEVDVDKEESVVAQWLAHLPLVLHVEVPLASRKISVSEHAFLSVICMDDKCAVLRIGTLTV